MNIKKMIKEILLKLKAFDLMRWGQAHLLVISPFFAKLYVSRAVGGRRLKKSIKGSGNRTRVAVIWDGARFNYLFKAAADEKIDLVKVERSVFSRVWAVLLKEYKASNQMNLGEYTLDYYLSERFSGDRAKFRVYCKNVAKTLVDNFCVDAFLMPKLNDDWTLEFIGALNELNFKIIVDDREGTVTSKRLEVVPARLKELLNVTFDRLTCHNEFHKKLFIDSGFPSEKIIVNGAPQTDYWFSRESWLDGKDIHPDISGRRFKILYFSFGPRTYLNFYYGDMKEDWTSLCRDYHEALLTILEKYPKDVQIIYKSGGKPLRDLYLGFDDFYRKAKPYFESGSILQLGGNVNSYDLIRNSQVILGFQTSGMIEALFTDRPVIYGAWGDLFTQIKDTLLPLHESDACTFCPDQGALVGALDQLIRRWKAGETVTVDETESRRALRQRYFSKADGLVSERLLRHVKQVVDAD